jgi:hypothetical protein
MRLYARIALCVAWLAFIVLESSGIARASDRTTSAADPLIDSGHVPATPSDSSASTDSFEMAADDSSFRSPEPPVDVTPGTDYVEDREARLPPGEIETSWGYAGRGTSSIRRRQRVRVSEDGLEAGLREGRADALPGAMARARLGASRVSVGVAPRGWGQSLIVGTPSEPWLEGGLDATSRRAGVRSRDGAEYERGSDTRLRVVALHGAGGSFAGASLERNGAGAGVLVLRESASRTLQPVASLWLAREPAATEIAFDGGGRWRLQTAWRAVESASHVALGARIGQTGFRSAVATRSGPATAVSAALERRLGAVSCSGLGALWRFRGARGGARGVLELRAFLPQHETFAVGAEERHGVRVDSERESQVAPPFRQRVWAGWTAGAPPLVMSLKHELWGSRGGLHAIRRGVTSAGVTASTPRGLRFALTHTLYRTEAGDTQYVGEQEDDRAVLRALSGAGRRTRFETGIPAVGGEIRAALIITAAARPAAPAWTIDWTRRARRS